MKSNGAKYSPAFKFQVVLEALQAEGGEPQAAQALAQILARRPNKDVLLRARGGGQLLDAGLLRPQEG